MSLKLGHVAEDITLQWTSCKTLKERIALERVTLINTYLSHLFHGLPPFSRGRCFLGRQGLNFLPPRRPSRYYFETSYSLTVG